MRLFALIEKDIRIFLKNPGALFLTFLVPMIITLIFGLVFGGIGSSSGIKEILVVGVDEDQSTLSKKMMAAVDSLDEIRLQQEYTEDEEGHRYTTELMDEQVKKGARHIGLRIAKGFEDSLKAGLKPSIYIHYDPKYPIEQGILNGLLQKTIMMQMPGLMQEQLFRRADEYLGTNSGNAFRNDILATVQNYFGVQAESLSIPSFQDTAAFGASAEGVDMENITPIKIRSNPLLGVDDENPMFAQYVAGMAVMFLLFSVTGAASSLLAEKREGTIKRLLISPAQTSEILWGKALFIMIIGIVQLLVMFLFGWLIFKLDIFKDVPALLVMIFSTAIACATLGMLLAAACKSQKQVDELSTLLILGMSALGGSMFPTFMIPSYLQIVGRFTLNYWAMTGFTNIFWRNMHLVDILPHAGILMGASVLFFLLARWLFQRRLFER